MAKKKPKPNPVTQERKVVKSFPPGTRKRVKELRDRQIKRIKRV